MGFTSFFKSPKKEEQHQVPDTILGSTKLVDSTNNGKYCHDEDDHEEVDIMDDLERILGVGDNTDEQNQKFDEGKIHNVGQLNWEFMHWVDEYEEEDLEEVKEENYKLFGSNETTKCFFEEERFNHGYYNNNKINENEGSVVIKREPVGFWDDDCSTVSLNLNLNYQEVLDAWSDRGSPWADHSFASNNSYMGEVPVMEEDRTKREASVMRYKEKRQTRLFSKKIRYEVRKLNADKRPRLKMSLVIMSQGREGTGARKYLKDNISSTDFTNQSYVWHKQIYPLDWSSTLSFLFMGLFLAVIFFIKRKAVINLKL